MMLEWLLLNREIKEIKSLLLIKERCIVIEGLMIRIFILRPLLKGKCLERSLCFITPKELHISELRLELFALSLIEKPSTQ